MIKVSTTRFSDIEVDEKDVIELPAGLIGFPELRCYVMLNHDEKSPFKWLQSLDDGAIAFVLINPLLFKPDYSVEVNEAEVADLEIESESDAVISVIVTMPSDPNKMTANLKAPLIFNLKNRRGRQVILNNAQYTTRHNIMDEAQKGASKVQQEALHEVIEKAKSEQSAKVSEEKAQDSVGKS